MTKSTLRLAVALSVLALGSTGAAHAATPLGALLTVDNATANPGDVARVRVIHNSPDAPAVDVRVNGALAFANLAFGGITDLAALPAGAYDIQVEPAGAGGAGPFVIDVAWEDFQGNTGFGRTFNPSADSGQFWFFTPDWTELIVKVIDGDAVNGKIWVYVGSLSNVAFDVTVTDTATGATQVYSNPLGTYASFADNDAFDSN